MLASVNKEDGGIYTIYVCQTCQDLVHEFTTRFEGSEWLYQHSAVSGQLSPSETPEQLLEDLRKRKLNPANP